MWGSGDKPGLEVPPRGSDACAHEMMPAPTPPCLGSAHGHGPGSRGTQIRKADFRVCLWVGELGALGNLESLKLDVS